MDWYSVLILIAGFYTAVLINAYTQGIIEMALLIPMMPFVWLSNKFNFSRINGGNWILEIGSRIISWNPMITIKTEHTQKVGAKYLWLPGNLKPRAKPYPLKWKRFLGFWYTRTVIKTDRLRLR